MDKKGSHSNYPHGRPHSDEHGRDGSIMGGYKTPEPLKAGVEDGLSSVDVLAREVEPEQGQQRGGDPRPARRGGESGGSQAGKTFVFG